MIQPLAAVLFDECACKGDQRQSSLKYVVLVCGIWNEDHSFPNERILVIGLNPGNFLPKLAVIRPHCYEEGLGEEDQ